MKHEVGYQESFYDSTHFVEKQKVIQISDNILSRSVFAHSSQTLIQYYLSNTFQFVGIHYYRSCNVTLKTLKKTKQTDRIRQI